MYMYYTNPSYGNTNTDQSSSVQSQQWQNNAWSHQAEQNVDNEFPGATVVDMSYDSNGHPYKMHIREADGSYRTVMLDVNLHVTYMINGYC
jgi:hypothetical protein